MDVHETLYPFDTTKKTHRVTVTVIKIRFVGSSCQLYNDNLHKRLSADVQQNTSFQGCIAMVLKQNINQGF